MAGGPTTGATSPDLVGLLSDVAHVVSASADLRVVLRDVATLSLCALRADRASILLSESDGRLAPAVSVGRTPDEVLWAHFREMPPLDPEHLPVAAMLFEQGRGVAIADALTTPLVPRELTSVFGIRSLVVAPITTQGARLGVIVVDQSETPRDFTAEEIQTLEGIGALAGIAVRTARGQAEAQQHASSLADLGEIALRARGAADALGYACAEPSGTADMPDLVYRVAPLVHAWTGGQLVDIQVIGVGVARRLGSVTLRGELSRVARAAHRGRTIGVLDRAAVLPLTVDGELVAAARVRPDAELSSPPSRLPQAAAFLSVLVERLLRRDAVAREAAETARWHDQATRALSLVQELTDVLHEVDGQLGRVGRATKDGRIEAAVSSIQQSVRRAEHAGRAVQDDPQASAGVDLRTAIRRTALRAAGDRVEVAVTASGDPRSVSAAARSALLDVIRVHVRAAARSAGATLVAIRVAAEDDDLVLTLNDDGAPLAARADREQDLLATLRRLQRSIERAGGHLNVRNAEFGVLVEARVSTGPAALRVATPTPRNPHTARGTVPQALRPVEASTGLSDPWEGN